MKTVLVTPRIEDVAAYSETRECVDVRWGKLLHEMGFLPMTVSLHSPIDELFQAVEIAGVIFTGGNNLCQVEPNRLSEMRDRFEKRLLDAALEQGVAVIGVCRGMQLLASHFGGELVQVEGHVAQRHALVLEKGAWCEPFLNRQTSVNSYHGWGIREMPAPLKTAARSAEGYVEAAYDPSRPVWGMMWHPEREDPFRLSEMELLSYVLNKDYLFQNSIV